MIFKKQEGTGTKTLTPLQRISNRIESIPVLRMSIVDISEDGETLVLLSASDGLDKLISVSLENHWPGPIEIYNTSDLAIGGTPRPIVVKAAGF